MTALTAHPARTAAIAAALTRAQNAGRLAFGYCSFTSQGGQLHPTGRVLVPGLTWAEQAAFLAKIDRVCVEGDLDWQLLPPDPPAPLPAHQRPAARGPRRGG